MCSLSEASSIRTLNKGGPVDQKMEEGGHTDACTWHVRVSDAHI